jgi:hypothetical protein
MGNQMFPVGLLLSKSIFSWILDQFQYHTKDSIS